MVSYTGAMSTPSPTNKLLRMPTEMLDQLATWASEEDRSVNNLIVHILRQALRERTERERAAREGSAA
jgi:hypothetical protein